ncbi:hypothetical protein WJX81_000823 [Elliptochloris bilobata]|uniref:Ribosome-recycling factor, chloroplastic n=1 Tax=Elliptochloris bilobata TaxID=381761 RepID=A0AAW1S853_9CHLO
MPAARRTCQASRLCLQAAAEESVEVDVEEDAMTRMEKSIESTKRSFGTVRTGRANPALLDRIEVDYYGAMTPVRQMANVSAPEASLLVIQPYDKSMIPAIERSIMTSDLALTPNSDGNVIRLNIPQLTADRRKELAKLVSKLGEEGKVAIRNVRRDAMKAVDALEKKGDLGEDEAKALSDTVQELTDDYVKQVDALVKSKQDELSTV